jgi:hypothetical protein
MLNHCCGCKRPYPMRVLKRGFKKLYLCTINCANFNQFQEKIQETTSDVMEIDQTEDTSQWNIVLIQKELKEFYELY